MAILTTSYFSGVILPDIREAYAHDFGGLHSNFKGRPYRRGKNRCSYCGAKK